VSLPQHASNVRERLEGHIDLGAAFMDDEAEELDVI
jgi:hypothetical protein